MAGNLSTPSRLRGCEYPKTNLRPQTIGAQSTWSLYQVVSQQISTSSNLEPFSSMKLVFKSVLVPRLCFTRPLWSHYLGFPVQKYLNPKEDLKIIHSPINHLPVLLCTIQKYRTKSSDSQSLEQEKAQKLLQYSLPEQTDKGLQHSKQSSKFKVCVRMIAPEINN